MNPIPLFLIIVTLPLLLVGCGEKAIVNDEELELHEGIYCLVGSDTPYTGKSFALYENGQKRSETNWKDGKMDGLWISWHENGQKGAETNFKDGKPDGQTIAWHDNGQKQSEANWKDGKLNGLKTTWYKNGQKFMKGNWKDGNKVSAKYWNPKGEPVNLFDETKTE